MKWLSLIVSIFSLLESLTKWLQQRQLIKAGEAIIINLMLEGANEAMQKAKNARDDARRRNESGGLLDNDKFRRD